MEEHQYRNFIHELGKINTRLNKIIMLLEPLLKPTIISLEDKHRVTDPTPIVVSKETAR